MGRFLDELDQQQGRDVVAEGFEERDRSVEEPAQEPMTYFQSLEGRLADLIRDVRGAGQGDPRSMAVTVTHLETAALWLAKAAK